MGNITDETQDPQPMNNGSQTEGQPPSGEPSLAADQRASHGTTGEGASSAMARLISQEQARQSTARADDAPTGSA